MLKLLLTKAEVDLAEDGLEAVTLVLTDPLKYDVIFMDNLLPKMVYYWMWNDCLKSIFSRQLFYELEWRGSGEEDSRRRVQEPYRWSDGQHSGGRRGRVLAGWR